LASLDGVIGPETKQALAAFQKANGLAVVNIPSLSTES
jgi:peptidoglycan hydrolase-like protein with peptidoglycan-binding domain